MHDAIEIRSFLQEDEASLIKLWEKCELVVAWNDPSKDISRKVQLHPKGLLLGWYDNSLIASVMAGYEGCGNLPGTIRMPQNQSADPGAESSGH